MPNLLTVPEFAAALHVTVACVRRWVLERRITTIRVGRLVRISPEEYQRIVDQGLVPARPQHPAEMRGSRTGS
jgi:excisionase family DNA binding protein